MKPGQPTKYDPKYCDEVKEHMHQGLSLESFAGKIGVHKDTIYEWQNKHEEFSDAVSIGRSMMTLFYEQMGRAAMIGKIDNFNSPVFIWMTKNMLKWRDKQEIDHTGIPNNPTVIRLALPEKNEK